MGRRKKVPSYWHHKASDQAVVRIDGKWIYLGQYGSPESEEKYARIVAEWQRANQSTRAFEPSSDLTIVELIAAYWKFAEERYGKGRDTTSYRMKPTLRVLKELYGQTRAIDFGPMALKTIARELVGKGYARTYVNMHMQRIRRIFKWAVGEEKLDVTVYQRLACVTDIRRGTAGVRESPRVTPVDDATVDATLPKLWPLVADMVRLQRLTGARPAEICKVRPCDVDRKSDPDVWLYHPKSHKTEYRDRDRVILFGPQAQKVLRPYLLRPDTAYCFSPREAKRRTRSAGERYTTASFRRAIHRACDRAGVPRWSPNQLRHSKATEVRHAFGLEGAQVMLGHAKADVTQVYAERDMALARTIAKQLG